MIVQIGNKTYRYFFKHFKNKFYYPDIDAEHELPVLAKARKKHRAATTCVIQEKVELGWSYCCTGSTWCSKDDRFVKEIGRCYALADALDKLGLNQEDRTKFANNYLNRNYEDRKNELFSMFMQDYCDPVYMMYITTT